MNDQKFIVFKDFPILIVKNFFNKEDLNDLKKEIELLKYFELSPEHTQSAFYNGKYIKKNKGIFVDEIFYNNELKNKSKILNINKKTYENETIKIIKNINLIWSLLQTSNKNTTLISYYKNSDYFLPHTDMASVTILSYFVEPNFSGGELVFDESEIKIEIEDNLVVYMLGSLLHSVESVSSPPEVSSRISMAQFFFHENKY